MNANDEILSSDCRPKDGTGEAMELYRDAPRTDLSISRPPDVILAEARKAAQALSDVISKKAKPVKFNGEQYLEFEDWLLVGRFYGVSVKIVSTQHVDYGEVQGFEAHAEAILVSTGAIISAADAMCLNDEQNWSKKPMFQLRSMAQTRACAKVLRNCLAWVVVLAGYRPTPAEEMSEVFRGKDMPEEQQEAKAGNGHTELPPNVISDAQRKRFYAITKSSHIPQDTVKEHLSIGYGYKSSTEIRRDKYEELCDWAQKQGGDVAPF